MKISVVIPVYNAERFLPEAIDSVLIQPEVKEILLVDDGSTDNSLELCHSLAEGHPEVIRVFRHPGGLNHGAAATRNLGMQNAHCDFIAFLDADDVYLTGRFAETRKILDDHPDADGVYETVVSIVYDHSTGEQIDPRAGHIKAGFPTALQPDTLFSALAIGKSGYIHLNGFVIKRSALDSSLFFDTDLRPCEDTDLLLRWAAYRKLYGGDQDKVISHRRVHDSNTVFDTTQALCCRYQCMRKCALKGFYGSMDRKANREILNRMARTTSLVAFARRTHLPVTPFRLAIVFGFLLRHPSVLSSI